MQRNFHLKSIALAFALMFSGCASYTPSLVRLNPSGAYVTKAVKGDLTVYIDEYATPEKSQRAFDTNMVNEGVLPLLISVENNSRQPYEVKLMDIRARDHKALKALTPEEAASKAGRNAVGLALGWSMIVPIISIPVAVAASAIHTSKVNDQIVRDFAAKAFTDGEIKPGKDRSGFVFFELPDGRPNLNIVVLELAARNLATNEVISISTNLGQNALASYRTMVEPATTAVSAGDNRLPTASEQISHSQKDKFTGNGIKQHLIGRTLVLEVKNRRGQPRTLWRYFVNDRVARQINSRDKERTGEWRVTSDGKICDTLTRTGHEVCYTNVSIDGGTLRMQSQRQSIEGQIVEGNPKSL